MIIMCDKCRKPARISQRVAEGLQELVITVRCHGARQDMRLSKAELESTPGLAAQINAGVGVAFRQDARAHG